MKIRAKTIRFLALIFWHIGLVCALIKLKFAFVPTIVLFMACAIALAQARAMALARAWLRPRAWAWGPGFWLLAPEIK